MNCTICGKATLPGAMLCGPCKAALKRARYMTVQEDIRRPSVIDVKRQARRPRPPAHVPAPVPATAAPASPPIPAPVVAAPIVSPPGDANATLGRRIFLGIFLVAAVLGGASYVGLRELNAHAGDAAAVPAAAPPPIARDVAASAPAKAPEEFAGPPAPDVIVPLPVSAPKPPVKRVVARAPPPVPDPVPVVTVAPEPEKPAPPPPPPPAPDRWQTMRDAQAQCDREGLIAGLICGQRVRIQYCDGYWGKVPQCQGANVPYDR